MRGVIVPGSDQFGNSVLEPGRSVQSRPQANGFAAAAQGAASLANASTQILSALADQRENEALSNSAIDIAAARQEFEQAPDIETAEGDFKQRIGEIRQINSEIVSRGPFGSGGKRFDLRFNQISEGHTQQLRSTIMAKARSQGVASGLSAAKEYSRQSALATDPDDRELFHLLAFEAVNDLEAQGFISARQAETARSGVDRSIALGEFSELIRTSPTAAVKLLDDPESRLSKGLTEAERQNNLTQAVNASESNLRSALDFDTKIAAAKERDRKAFQVKAERSFIRLSEPDGPGLTIKAVDEKAEILSPASLEKWREVAESGGRRVPRSLSGQRWVDIRKRIRAGDPELEDELLGDVANGDLSAGMAESLLDEAEKQRLGPARDLLEAGVEAAKVGRLPGQSILAERAVQEFEDWVLQNPKATRDEAKVEAESISDRADIFGIVSNQFSELLPPQYKRRPDRSIDIDASRDSVRESFRSRSMTKPDAEAAITDLDRRELIEQRNQGRGSK